LAADAGKPRWGEKTPANVRHIARILVNFSQAQFIHIIRDGRDVACSLRTHPEHVWAEGRHVRSGIVNSWDDCIAEWHNDVTAGIAFRTDPRYFEIRYETLTADPESLLRDLFGWLRIDWSHEVLEQYRRPGMPNHTGLAGPISQSSVGRWSRDLPAEARALFRGAPNELLKSLGYLDDEHWIDNERAAAPSGSKREAEAISCR
jgi:hypothetical protein